MLEIVRFFFCGAACGSFLALCLTRIHNSMTFKKEEELNVNQILMWVIIGFIIGGAMGAAFLR